MNTTTIRQAMTFDRDIVKELAREHSENLSFLPDAALHHYLQLGGCFLDEGFNEPCGMLVGVRSYQSRPALAGIIQLAVPKDHWRQKIATELLCAFVDDAFYHGALAMQAWVREDLPANKFFQARKFEPVAQVPGGVKRNKKMICWWRPLQIGTTPHGISAPTAHRRGPRDASPVLEPEHGAIIV